MLQPGFKVPELKVRLIGKVVNPGDEGWHGMTAEQQKQLEEETTHEHNSH